MQEITHKAIRALIIFFLVLALYITVRFEWRMAIAALAAVVHDVLISVGVYSLFGFEVTPATVIAFLTILGFSLYDTIVVFDKVHENTRRVLATGRATYGDVVNLSMNQVLARSLNTTLSRGAPRAVAALRRVDPDGRDCAARTSRSRCSSVSSPARTRRSSSPRRSWLRSRSASLATER